MTNKIFKPTPQQQAVIDWYVNETGCLVLIARAGAGKSSTAFMVVKKAIELNPRISIGIGAFNRPIADEFDAKIKKAGITFKNATANTMHGFGLTPLRKHFGWGLNLDKILDGNKLKKILLSYMITEEQKEKVEPYLSLILKTTSMAKQRAFGVLCEISDRSKWFDIIDHFGYDEDLDERHQDLDFAITVCIWLFKRSITIAKETIDYDDMIFLPLYLKLKLWQYDVVIIDEAQDTNHARRALARRLLKPGGRMIAIGDDRQAIYGFTGADSDSLNLIRDSFDSKVLPLTVSQRCNLVAIRRAQRYVPDIEACIDAPEGIERTIYLENKDPEVTRPTIIQETLTKDDGILCRNTAPLISLAYKLLKAGVPCKVEGRKIGEGIIFLVNRWKIVNIPALLKKLEEYKEKEIAKWVAKEREDKADEISDKVETINVLAQKLLGEGKNRVSDLVEFIDSMFTDTKEGKPAQCVTLATCHKAKGREWKRVFLLDINKYIPSKWARKDWQKEQENNLAFVALTRVMFTRDDEGNIIHEGELIDIIDE